MPSPTRLSRLNSIWVETASSKTSMLPRLSVTTLPRTTLRVPPTAKPSSLAVSLLCTMWLLLSPSRNIAYSVLPDATFEATRAFADEVTMTAPTPGSRTTLWSTTALVV